MQHSPLYLNNMMVRIFFKKIYVLNVYSSCCIAPLLPLYIFESKMTFLLTFAMYKEGAEFLYTHRIFEILGQCQFMKAQKQYSTSVETNTDSIAELDDRYRQVFIPTVSIVAAILISFRGENKDVIKRVSV